MSDKAIRQATRIGSRHDVALANWHAGEYFLAKKHDTDWASCYVNKVHWLYRDWEAHRMCEYLKSKYVDKVNIYWDSQTGRSTTRYSRLHSVTEQVNIDEFADSLWDESVRLGGIHRTGLAAATRGEVIVHPVVIVVVVVDAVVGLDADGNAVHSPRVHGKRIVIVHLASSSLSLWW